MSEFDEPVAGESAPVEAVAAADPPEPVVEGEGDDKVRCEACPVRCFITVGQTGSCDRYGNVDGVLTRLDPVVILRETVAAGGEVVDFAPGADEERMAVSYTHLTLPTTPYV